MSLVCWLRDSDLSLGSVQFYSWFEHIPIGKTDAIS